MRSKLILFAVILVSVAQLVACSSPVKEPRYYLMRSEVPGQSGRLDGSVRAGLGRLIVAPYLLSNQGIVVETAPGEVRAAREHQWAEPLDAGLRWFLRGEIARAFGGEIGGGVIDRRDWDYTIDIFVARFHGTMNGTALLEGTYTIRPASASEKSREYRFSRSQPLSDEGYAALVAAEQSLASDLGGSIAETLRELMAARQAEVP